MNLTGISASCSDADVVIANELYRRSAVDLLRTTSALCLAC